MSAPRWRVRAPAKLTMTLEITGVRADGYHELATEMVSPAYHLSCFTLTFHFDDGTSPSASLLVLDGVNLLIRLSRPSLRTRARCRAHR